MTLIELKEKHFLDNNYMIKLNMIIWGKKQAPAPPPPPPPRKLLKKRITKNKLEF